MLSALLLQGVTSAFCTYPRGLPLSPATMTTYFKVRTAAASGSCTALQVPPLHSHTFRCTMQDWVNMCPKRARHVFITDRLKNPHIPGPDNESAALAMGNTVEQWTRTYYPQVIHDRVSCSSCPAQPSPAQPSPAQPSPAQHTCCSLELCIVLCR